MALSFSDVFSQLLDQYGSRCNVNEYDDNCVFQPSATAADADLENSVDFALIESIRDVFNGVGRDIDHEEDETNDVEHLNEDIDEAIDQSQYEEDVENREDETDFEAEADGNDDGSTSKQKKRRQSTMASKKEKHPMLPPCNCKHKKCQHLIREERRLFIHDKFWEKDLRDQNSWTMSHVRATEKKRSLKRKPDNQSVRKERGQLCYTLAEESGLHIDVCQRMFLDTLGFTSNQKIVSVCERFEKGNAEVQEQRGKTQPKNKKGEEVITLVHDHIFSFHPSISHYRRKHAPLRLYLSPEINMTTMYKDFCEKFPDMVSYEFYRQRIKEYNISFCKLGEEECDFCLSFKLHAPDDISREEDTYTVGEFIYIEL